MLALKHPNSCGVPVSPHGAAPYLAQRVDVDLAPLPALAEVHGRSHQQNVGDAVAVDVEGVDLTAVVGADLQETEEGMGWEQRPQRAGALPPSPAGATGTFRAPSLLQHRDSELRVRRQPGHPQLPVGASRCSAI